MNNLIHSLSNCSSRVIFAWVLGSLILGNFINHWGYFIGVISAVAIVSLIRFFHDRKWLKDAEKYVRITQKRAIWRRVIEFVVQMGITLILVEFTHFIHQYVHQNTTITFFIVFIPLYFESYYSKFVDSIKSFEKGVQLPGRNQKVVPWREVYDLSFNGKLFISSSKGDQEFFIHEDDPEHATGMISDWKYRTGRQD